MNTEFPVADQGLTPPVWAVGALVHAVAGALESRFNPVAVRGEVSSFNRAASGHCYFTLKDAGGQMRCAMFRRTASLLDFEPREGDQVELRGRLSVYEARGDLQLIVEAMARSGQGALFERFLRLKAKLQAEGLFEAGRKRPLPELPRGIGVVTSLGAAALRDVLAALARRAPHVPVLLAPAPVQGEGAPQALCAALERLYPLARGQAQSPGSDTAAPPIDLILLVRGGGSIEDLWAFNDEELARVIVRSPVPVIVGVGHETDFTIADFVADLRAPTPTAAAELASTPREQWLDRLAAQQARLMRAVRTRLDNEAQRADRLAARLGRPSAAVATEQLRLARHSQRLRSAGLGLLQGERQRLARLAERLPQAAHGTLDAAGQRLERASLRLALLDPQLVLERGYAWLQDETGHPISRASQAWVGQPLAAILADGRVDMTVTGHESR